MNKNSQIQLEVAKLQTEQFHGQVLVINLPKPGDLFLPYDLKTGEPFSARIEPSSLETLELPPLDSDLGVVLFGNGPIWLYTYLVNQCHKFPWIACFSAPLGKAIIVKSSVAELQVGDLIAIPARNVPGMAIAIGGPPDSGKSILSNALRSTLSRYYPDLKIFVHRANWDGEGNWSYETKDKQIVEKLVRQGEYRIHELPNSESLIKNYFKYHAQATQNIRKIVDLTIVDLGGVPQPQKQPVVEQCTHYMIISSQPDKIQAWHDAFQGCLKPLAVLHTKASPGLTLAPNNCFLEQTLDLSSLIQTAQIPDELLKTIIQGWETHQLQSGAAE